MEGDFQQLPGRTRLGPTDSPCSCPAPHGATATDGPGSFPRFVLLRGGRSRGGTLNPQELLEVEIKVTIHTVALQASGLERPAELCFGCLG